MFPLPLLLLFSPAFTSYFTFLISIFPFFPLHHPFHLLLGIVYFVIRHSCSLSPRSLFPLAPSYFSPSLFPRAPSFPSLFFLSSLSLSPRSLFSSYSLFPLTSLFPLAPSYFSLPLSPRPIFPSIPLPIHSLPLPPHLLFHLALSSFSLSFPLSSLSVSLPLSLPSLSSYLFPSLSLPSCSHYTSLHFLPRSLFPLAPTTPRSIFFLAPSSLLLPLHLAPFSSALPVPLSLLLIPSFLSPCSLSLLLNFPMRLYLSILFQHGLLGSLLLPASWARIFKLLWSPGIDSKEWIAPSYVAWRADTIKVSSPHRLFKNSSSERLKSTPLPCKIHGLAICYNIIKYVSIQRSSGILPQECTYFLLLSSEREWFIISWNKYMYSSFRGLSCPVFSLVIVLQCLFSWEKRDGRLMYSK